MDLYKALPIADVDFLYSYIQRFGYCSPSRNHMDHILRYWNQNKVNLYKMFDNNFIIKKEIKFEKQEMELKEEMYNIIRNYHHEFLDNPSNRFADTMIKLAQKIHHGFDGKIEDIVLASEIFSAIIDMMTECDTLVANRYDGNSVTIPGSITVDGKELRIQSGCKAVKMLGKIAKAFGVDEDFEAFRQAHSQVLNQKLVTGTLCLSIHPMDYATMSDNDCDWSSCMSWREDGDYRLGTVEMMNSPCVVVAYVESKEDMKECGYEWNNKKWRQLYIVTPEVILGNRQYPYENEFIQGAALKWLRELASVTPGYGPYEETVSNIYNGNSRPYGEKCIRFTFESDYMYNDVYGDRYGYIGTDLRDGQHVYINFSGPAVCLTCGEVMPLDEVEAHQFECPECSGLWKCDCCGDWSSDTPYYVGDARYCSWCYDHELDNCVCCDDKVIDGHNIGVVLHADKIDGVSRIDLPLPHYHFNWRYGVTVCEDCLKYGDAELNHYGPLLTIKSTSGYESKVFDIKNFDELGINSLDAPRYIKDYLIELRNATTWEEELKILEKIVY
jgi:hypothetical protein